MQTLLEGDSLALCFAQSQNCCLSQATAAAADTFQMVYSRRLKSYFSKLLQHRLDLTTENLWTLLEGHYTLIGRKMSRKFKISLTIPQCLLYLFSLNYSYVNSDTCSCPLITQERTTTKNALKYIFVYKPDIFPYPGLELTSSQHCLRLGAIERLGDTMPSTVCQ